MHASDNKPTDARHTGHQNKITTKTKAIVDQSQQPVVLFIRMSNALCIGLAPVDHILMKFMIKFYMMDKAYLSCIVNRRHTRGYLEWSFQITPDSWIQGWLDGAERQQGHG